MATLSDLIREAITSSGGMSATQLMDVLPEGTDKNTVWALLSQRKKAGEFGSRVEDGMLVYFVADPAAPKQPADAATETTKPQPPAASRQPPAKSVQSLRRLSSPARRPHVTTSKPPATRRQRFAPRWSSTMPRPATRWRCTSRRSRISGSTTPCAMRAITRGPRWTSSC